MFVWASVGHYSTGWCDRQEKTTHIRFGSSNILEFRIFLLFTILLLRIFLWRLYLARMCKCVYVYFTGSLSLTQLVSQSVKPGIIGFLEVWVVNIQEEIIFYVEKDWWVLISATYISVVYTKSKDSIFLRIKYSNRHHHIWQKMSRPVSILQTCSEVYSLVISSHPIELNWLWLIHYKFTFYLWSARKGVMWCLQYGRKKFNSKIWIHTIYKNHKCIQIFKLNFL